MIRYLTKDRAAVAVPLAVAVLLLPWRAIGRLMLTSRPGARPSLQARPVAVTLADQAGRALGAWVPASAR